MTDLEIPDNVIKLVCDTYDAALEQVAEQERANDPGEGDHEEIVAKPGLESVTDPDELAKVKELAEVIDDAMDTSVRAHGQIPNWHWDGPLNAADAVLSRYTITRKQPEGADRG